MNAKAVCLICLLATVASAYQTENVFIVNIDGMRWQDGPATGNVNMPFLWDSLRPQGTLYTEFSNRGITITNAAHSTIVSGVQQLLLNNYGCITPVRPREPTIGEYFLRALAGIGLAGTYVPGMRLVAQRFRAENRGVAIACYASAFGVGSAASLSAAGQLARLSGWRLAMGMTAIGPLLAALLAAFVLAPAPPPPGQPSRLLDIRVFRNRPALWMIASYCAHNWELFGMRAWLPPFLAASLIRSGAGVVEASSFAAAWTAVVLLIGSVSNVGGVGWVSDRWGRSPVTSQ